MKRNFWQGILLLLGLSVLATVILLSTDKSSGVVINEVCSSNFVAAQDENGEYPDCIELYNSSKEEVSLKGCYLTDDENELEKYSLDHITIPGDGYTLIWLNEESGLRISKTGENLFLVDSERGVYLDQINVPSLSHDTSYGRVQDGKADWSAMSTTLGSSNEDAVLLPTISLKKPVFGTASGFYDNAFELYLYSPDDAEIYYTLDGSEPSMNSPVYKKPLWIMDNSLEENRYASRQDLSPSRDYTPDFLVDKAVVVRAMCCNCATNQVSDIVTETFFIGYNTKAEYNNMAVISLVIDPEDLFDSRTGIYGNGIRYEEYLEKGGEKDGSILDSYTDDSGETRYRYTASNAFNTGREWERAASFTYFDETHSLLFTQNTGVRISGNSTRGAIQKAMNIFARKIYDNTENIPYDFFNRGLTYSTIKLRNGGGNSGSIKFLDAFLQQAAVGRNISIQESKPCIVFLNGEYWGIYNIRERYKPEYLAAVYGLDPSSVMIIKADEAVTSFEETMEAYHYMLDVVTECDLAYDDTYAMACELVDIQSLIDYCCINLYLDNRDVAFGYNTALWRSVQEETSLGDGKWRFMLYDMDECIFPDSNDWENRENWMAEHPLLNEPCVISLLDNEDFRRQFCISFMDIANTTFSYDKMHSMLMQWSGFYEPQFIKDRQRFYDPAYSEVQFYDEMADVDNFFQARFPFAMESLAKTFQIQGELTKISLDSNMPDGGTFIINTAFLEDCGTWEGYYYNDFPVSITVQPNEGYRFVSWDGDTSSSDTSLNVSLKNGDVSFKALFEKVE